MALEIPLNSAGSRRIFVDLNRQPFGIRTYWNPTARTWFMDLTDRLDNPILLGMAMVPEINLFEAFPGLTSTIGQFRVIVTDGGENNTIDSLGNTAFLIYFPPGEFESTYPNFDDPGINPLTYNFDDLFTVVT